jgi:hypothetical protein
VTTDNDIENNESQTESKSAENLIVKTKMTIQNQTVYSKDLKATKTSILSLVTEKT